MTQIGRRFSLSAEPGRGVFCDQNGLFVGGVPLLERRRNSRGVAEWQPRPAIDLNRDLRKYYGMPIEFENKIGGLAGICRALNRGDLVHAQIATLHLQIPNPPLLQVSGQPGGATVDLARTLQASGLLKIQEAWDEEKHPRWPAGSPDSVGGQFAPLDAGVGSSQPAASETASTVQAQATIAVPLESPILAPRIPPIPFAPPDISPRDLPQNPYPDRPECEQEWAEAYRRCFEYLKKGQLGADGHRGMGKFLYQCILGQVSEDLRRQPEKPRLSRSGNLKMENEPMKQPTTPDEIAALHKLLRSDPQQYLRIVNRWIAADPKGSGAYFTRHFVWEKIGAPREAIGDLNKVAELEPKPHPITFLARGHIYRQLGEYEKAIEDFARAEAIDPVEWRDSAFGPFFQADTHARLGNEVAALECCALLPDDFWTPGFEGAPGGGKMEIADELRRRAAQARRKRS